MVTRCSSLSIVFSSVLQCKFLEDCEKNSRFVLTVWLIFGMHRVYMTARIKTLTTDINKSEAEQTFRNCVNMQETTD